MRVWGWAVFLGRSVKSGKSGQRPSRMFIGLRMGKDSWWVSMVRREVRVFCKSGVYGKSVSVPKFYSPEGTRGTVSISYPLVLLQIEILSQVCVCVNGLAQTVEHPEMGKSWHGRQTERGPCGWRVGNWGFILM